MSGQPPSEEGREELRCERRRFRSAVERQGERHRRFRRAGDRGLWFGLSSFGMVGWSIAVPTLLGVALGLWLDARFGGGIRYTLSLLVAGLALGITNVWRWIQLQAEETDAEVGSEPGGEAAGDDGAGAGEGDGPQGRRGGPVG